MQSYTTMVENKMAAKFKQTKFGEEEEFVIRLSRKQIEQMAQMAAHFKIGRAHV